MVTFTWDSHLPISYKHNDDGSTTHIEITYTDRFNNSVGPFCATLPVTEGAFKIAVYPGGRDGVQVRIEKLDDSPNTQCHKNYVANL
ncbi:hypothetical protein COY32_06630 [candidate division WWE3 bacterium CG_4_10_14_0_2_um_filter_41_14]|uniref:Uncharacterized protein n=1 Tax=candidate division WWE3 bacterium CG_4_10_14_0_2_um_filter_41_14 TaxID=1975072 RepID=A0A2M7TFS4_UNCKA|nr:MAG: hypothetical protein COY32_06630 [candidate division WWE3 bacterium CG_4_10_14_0_2_um_filter_41_14]